MERKTNENTERRIFRWKCGKTKQKTGRSMKNGRTERQKERKTGTQRRRERKRKREITRKH
jgi:hypothetical protein